MSTRKKKSTMWELWVKFYFRQNDEVYNPGESISDSSEELLLGYSPDFAPNKIYLTTLTLCIFFFQSALLATNKRDPELTSLLRLNSARTGALVPAEASWAHLTPQRVQTDLGESLLVLGSPKLVDEFYLEVYNKYLGPQWRDTGVCSVVGD